MRIAIVGSGISGLVAARQLSTDHEISLFEAGYTLGGHTHTVEVTVGGATHFVDTGFIVFNRRNYPRFDRLLRKLDVASQPSDMSFSVKDPARDLEYNGNNLNTLFAQRSNLLRPSFHRMLLDILRFHREAPQLLTGAEGDLTLGEFLGRGGYGSEFRHDFIVPMGAAIWSASLRDIESMPAKFFIRFFRNHGLLNVTDRPLWRVITGGSFRYVQKLTASFADRIHLSSPVQWIRRHPDGVTLGVRGQTLKFDRVVIATHSDQALRLLADASAAEQMVLGAIPYRANEAVLHTDTSVLPKRRLAWAAWNYHLGADAEQPAAVTYYMNLLQSIPHTTPFCVTLNATSQIDPAKVLDRFIYHHPVYTAEAVAAQARVGEVSGVNRTHYCGAYWGNGFHEDGVVSGERAAREVALATTGFPGSPGANSPGQSAAG
jgi:predicted NAD/FAD-binding protein